jgi:hypothetical protein
MSSAHQGLEKTVVHLPGGDVPLTRRDAQQIRDALQTYLAAAGEFQPPLPKEAGEAWIDFQGHVRTGPWLLEPRGGGLALTYRQPPPVTRVSYRYVAHLQRTKEGWKVTAITLDQIMPRE